MNKTEPITPILFSFLCLILFLFVTVLPANAQEKTPGTKDESAQKQTEPAGTPERKWTEIMKTANDVDHFYDKDSIVRQEKNIIQVWRRQVYPRRLPQQERISLDEIDCKREKYRSVEVHVKYWDNTTEEFKKVSPWATIWRGYPEEFFLEKHCD
jgi:hypothetical protein